MLESRGVFGGINMEQQGTGVPRFTDTFLDLTRWELVCDTGGADHPGGFARWMHVLGNGTLADLGKQGKQLVHLCGCEDAFRALRVQIGER